jgi:HK97 family phage major capsid protein
MTVLNNALEVKHNPDIAAAFDEFSRTFETFKEDNDFRLKQVEKRLSADVLSEEKVDRINQALDEQKSRLDHLVLKSRRPMVGADLPADAPQSREHKAAFNRYMRAGEADGLKQLEEKALSAGSGPDGGYLVPVPAEREILRRMALISPIRQIASIREISTATYKKAFSLVGPQAGWVAETAARAQTNTPGLQDLSFQAFEIFAQPAATQTLLDDAAVDVETWLAGEVETVLAEQEGAAFVNGDGINKPRGFMNVPAVAQASWAWGSLGYLATGTAAALNATAPSDVLVDLIYALKAGYRQNASFVMNRRVQAVIRKIKATTGEYLWQAPTMAGAMASLMNFPVVEAEDMPDIAAGSNAIAFGDFNRGYIIVDRMGVRVLRDPYSAKPYVLFYTTKRVGGGVQDFDAIKLLKFAVS